MQFWHKHKCSIHVDVFSRFGAFHPVLEKDAALWFQLGNPLSLEVGKMNEQFFLTQFEGLRIEGAASAQNMKHSEVDCKLSSFLTVR